MSRREHLPGTAAVEWFVEELIGGVDADHIEESGGPIGFALAIVEGGCCCERIGRGADAYDTACLRCQADALLRALDGEDVEEVLYGVARMERAP